MVLKKNLCVLVLRTKVASAFEGLIHFPLEYIHGLTTLKIPQVELYLNNIWRGIVKCIRDNNFQGNNSHNIALLLRYFCMPQTIDVLNIQLRERKREWLLQSRSSICRIAARLFWLVLGCGSLPSSSSSIPNKLCIKFPEKETKVVSQRGEAEQTSTINI